jgi:hypothetical protein
MIIWLKEIAIGFLVSLVIMVLMLLLIQFDIAPYTAPPPLAFAAAMNLHPWPTQGMIIHYIYGIFSALMFVVLFRRRLTLRNGLLHGLLMWTVFMLVISPVVGWGYFGIRVAEYARVPDDPLYVRSLPGFLSVSLLLNLAQGAMIGWLSRRWIGLSARRSSRTQPRPSILVR